jgi:Flp pilus assembly protein TadD
MATLTVPQARTVGVQQHRAGNLPEAEQIYRALLTVDRQPVDALYLLGLLAYQQGQYEPASVYVGEVVRLKPASAEAHNSLGTALQQLEHFVKVTHSYRPGLFACSAATDIQRTNNDVVPPISLRTKEKRL